MSEPRDLPPFPFFLGCGRSGTTLVQLMFDRHPDMAMVPERHFPLATPRRWVLPDGSLNLPRAIRRIENARWFYRFEMDAGVFEAAALDAQPTTYAEVIRCLNAGYARSRGKSRYGNKTPKHVLHIPEIAALFPEARFVHIVRDGRDVALSYLSKNFGPSDVRSAADVWRTRVERGRADGTKIGERRYAELRYEDLLKDPEAELRRICAFLELPFDDAMLRYHENGPVPSLRRDPNEHLAKPPTKGLRDWRTQMPPSDIMTFESKAGAALDAFGYERSGIAPTRRDGALLRAGQVAADARARAEQLKVSATTAARRVRPARTGRRHHV
jgi:Sulfotransferase family